MCIIESGDGWFYGAKPDGWFYRWSPPDSGEFHTECIDWDARWPDMAPSVGW